MKFLSLSILILLSSSSIFSNEKTETEKPTLIQKITTAGTFLAKLAAASAIALSAHHVLEYASTYAHEHGHGIASGQDYDITILPNKSKSNLSKLFIPWLGITDFYDEPTNVLLTTLAGPLIGTSTTYAQMVALKVLDGYMHSKSLSESLYEGVKYPITFFTNAMETGKKYTSMIIDQQSADSLTDKSITSLAIDELLFARMGRLVLESIYGLLPYKVGNVPGRPDILGDGEAIWKMIFGPNIPTFTGKLTRMVLATMVSPYIVGAAQVVYKKIQPQKTFVKPTQPQQVPPQEYLKEETSPF